MLRVVLDTNVIVSALLFRGVPSQLVGLWREKRFTPLVSKAMVEEYLRVLAYPRFRLSAEEVKALVECQLLPFAHPVRVRDVPAVIQRDPSDDVFIGCAVAGKAHYVVSGDRHLLDLKKYKAIPIISASEFLSEIKADVTLNR